MVPILSYMHDAGKQVAIHIRTPKKRIDTHAHKRAKAHLHTHEHDTERKREKHKIVSVKHLPPTPSVPKPAPTSEPPRFVVPKKPTVIEGINMTALHVAYFCMEIGLDTRIPTYAGGLGILAGDTLKSAADLEIPMIGVSLLYRKGYFRQRFDDSGWQIEEDEKWEPREILIRLPHEVTLAIEGRTVKVCAWMYKLKGIKGNANPVIFLDTDVEGNAEGDRHMTERLYGGLVDNDKHHRLLQEAVLGIAGVRMLEKLGATKLEKYHMNEGHSALLTVELYRRFAAAPKPVEEVRAHSVFTTHTPVAAGHDVFPRALATQLLGEDFVPEKIAGLAFEDDQLNMTRLALNLSGYHNGVAKKHGEVSRELFPGYNIASITNGVHVETWVAAPLAKLYDRYFPDWRADPFSLRYAISIPQDELWSAHQEAKHTLVSYLKERHGVHMSEDKFTIGFARRGASYKRGNLLFSDIERLLSIAGNSKGIQIVYGGKAHRFDHQGKLMLQEIIQNMRRIGHSITAIYIEDYDMETAKLMVAGVDLWLNTPVRPQEASGTSGMKAALNGVPQFSILDGWWLEGHIENVTGWSIGPHPENARSGNPDQEDVEDLYAKLAHVIIPKYEGDRSEWVKVMRQAIAINGSFFNTHRMIEQYVVGAYFK